MLLKNAINNYRCGTWSFNLFDEEGIISWAPERGRTHIHFGYNDIDKEPEMVGDYESLALALNLFKIKDKPLTDYIEIIEVAPLLDV